MKTVRLVDIRGTTLGSVEVPDNLPVVIRLNQHPPTVAVRDDTIAHQYLMYPLDHAATVLPLNPWEQTHDQRYRGEAIEEAIGDLHTRLSEVERKLNTE